MSTTVLILEATANSIVRILTYGSWGRCGRANDDASPGRTVYEVITLKADQWFQ
jgi:hypothetical protein